MDQLINTSQIGPTGEELPEIDLLDVLAQRKVLYVSYPANYPYWPSLLGLLAAQSSPVVESPRE